MKEVKFHQIFIQISKTLVFTLKQLMYQEHEGVCSYQNNIVAAFCKTIVVPKTHLGETG